MPRYTSSETAHWWIRHGNVVPFGLGPYNAPHDDLLALKHEGKLTWDDLLTVTLSLQQMMFE